MSKDLVRCVTLGAVLGLLTACSSYREAGGEDPEVALEQAAAEAVDLFKTTDPSLSKFFETAAGYAVYPHVTKGAAGIGAAHGDGVFYEDGVVVGYTDVSQGSIGVQLGGQVYSELIFFQTQANVDQFKEGNLEFSAQASAVAAKSGAAANSDYASGVAVFTVGQAGLMFEASIGGQKFSYTPKN